MKKALSLIGFISGILGVIISVTPLFNLSLIPGLIAVICLVLLWLQSRKLDRPTKFIQYISLLVLVIISMTIYKAVFSINELKNTEELELKEEESKDDSIEILEDLEIDE